MPLILPSEPARALASSGPFSKPPFVSYVEGADNITPIRTFFWRNGNQDAALKGPWKYLNDGTREYLFNLSIDHREQANFREQNPEMFDRLKAEFKAWEATVLPRPVPKR